MVPSTGCKIGFELACAPLRGGNGLACCSPSEAEEIGFELDSHPLRGASKLGSFGFVFRVVRGRNRGDFQRKALYYQDLELYCPDSHWVRFAKNFPFG